jgi:hypothetical protein
MQPDEWRLVKEHRCRPLLLLGDPYTDFCRRFYNRHRTLNKYSDEDEESASIHLLKVELGEFEKPWKEAPYESDLRCHNPYAANFQTLDLDRIDAKLRTWLPEHVDVASLGGNSFVLLNHHSLLQCHELLVSMDKVVFVGTSEGRLFEAYSVDPRNGVHYFNTCVYPGVQVRTWPQPQARTEARVTMNSPS